MKRLFFIIYLPVIAVGVMWSQGQSEGMRKLSLADFAITNLYVDEVDENKLVEDAIRGMLDPQTTETPRQPSSSSSFPKLVPLGGSAPFVGSRLPCIVVPEVRRERG